MRFPLRFDPTYARLSRPFGITPRNSWVEVGDTMLRAKYGPWRLKTPLANVAGVEITGPYKLYKTAGPARLAITDWGLSFTSNGDRGVLISFRDRVWVVGPHPELTVTVADVDGLAAALRASTSAR